MRARRVRPVFLFALAAVIMVSCRDGTGPGVLTGQFALAPSFASAAAGIVTIAQVRVRLVRADASVALDTTVTVPAGADSLALTLTVTLNQPNEVFQMYLDFITPPPARDTAFRAGPVAVASSSSSTAPVPIEVNPVYVGVGANAASVVITTPPGTTLLPGLATAVSAEARDAGGQPIPGTPIAWASLDAAQATVPDPAVGSVVGGTTAGAARITATLLTGPADTVSLQTLPAPDLLLKVSGDGQTGTAGTQLPVPLAVQVLGSDLPLPGVTVQFATADGGSFSAASVVTDASGLAQTMWTLGTTVGTQTATVTLAGFPSPQTTFSATAAAGSTVDWNNASGGSWSDPANWTPNRVPGAADTAVIALAGSYTVTLSTSATVAALTLGGASGGQTLALGAGSSLGVTGNATVNGAGVIEMNGAHLASPGGLLTSSGTLRVTGGVAELNAPSLVSGPVDVQAGQLEVWLGGSFAGPLSVASGATLTVLSAAALDLSGSSTVDGALAVQGTAGVAFGGGTHSFGTSSSVTGAGDFDVVTGSVTVLGAYDLTGITGILGGALAFENSTTPAVTSEFVMAGGALGGAGDLEVVAAFDWAGGTIGGTGQLRLLSTATSSIGGITAMILDGRPLVNQGSLTWLTGDIDAQNGAAITNAALATFDVLAPDGSVLDNTVGAATLTNDGTMTVTSDGVVSVNADVVNNGTLDIQTGSVAPTGSFTHADGAVLQGNGTLNLAAATVTALDGDVNPGTSPGALTVSGALPLSTLSAVNVELNGTTAGSQYDQLNVLGRATFGGVLNITAGFTPVVGDQFTVLTFSGGRAGGFTAVNGLDLGGGLRLDTLWMGTELRLVVPEPQILFAGDSSGGLSSGIFRVNSDATGLFRVTPEGPSGTVHPRWSPDRTRITYSATGGFPEPNLLHVTSATGTPIAHLVNDTSTFMPRYSPDGKHLAFGCGDGFSQFDVCVVANVDGLISGLDFIGDGAGKTYVTDFDQVNRKDGPEAFAWDPLNPTRLAIVRDSSDGVNPTSSRIYTVDYTGANVVPLSPDEMNAGNGVLRIFGAMDWSSDGTMLVFAAQDTTFALKLYVINRDGTGLRQLTFLTGYDDTPIFSPDGSEVLFGRDQSCSYDGWIVDINNTDGTLERRITDEQVCDFDTSILGADWSPDGSQIALTGFDTPYGNVLIYVVPRTVTDATYFTERKIAGRGVDLGGFVRDIQPSWRP